MKRAYGSLVKRLRKMAGLTGEQLAKEVGIDRTYVSQIENGRVFPSFLTYLKIRQLLVFTKDIEKTIQTYEEYKRYETS